ncbi:MAG: hypothetical protein Q9217_006936, partial [Psora testacea]
MLMSFAAEQDDRPNQHDPAPGEISTANHRPRNFGQRTVSHPDKRPPSPPIDPQLGFDGPTQSPSTESSRSSTASGTPYQGGAFNNLETHTHHQPPPTTSQANAMPPPIAQSPYQNPSYSGNPPTSSPYAYPPPVTTGSQPIYYQRPLPSTFPPNVSATVNPTTPTS